MAATLETLRVVIETDLKKYKETLEQARKEAVKTASAIDDALSKGGKGATGFDDTKQAAEETKEAVEEVVEAEKEAENAAKKTAGAMSDTADYAEKLSSIVGEVNTLIKGFGNRARLASGLESLTDEAAQYAGNIIELKAQLLEAIELRDQFMKEGLETAELDLAIEQLSAGIGYAEEKLNGLVRSGEAFQLNRPQSAVRYLAAYIQQLGRVSRGAVVSSLPAGLKAIGERLRIVGQYAKGAWRNIKNFAIGVKNDFKVALGWAKRLASGFGRVFAKIPLLGAGFKRLQGSMNKAFGPGMLRNLLRYASIGTLIYMGVRYAREGFENLMGYSKQTRNDINTLKGALLTMKNALATAFAPVLSVIVPVLKTLIKWVTAAATAIAHFTAAFTGKSTVVVAKDVTDDYAASLGNEAEAADKAKESAEEYKKTLLGFDQINKLNDQDKNTSGSGSGGGVGGGGLDASDMFETVDVSNKAKSLVDKIKESWKKADFTDLGKTIGNKIADALEKIPWKKIKKNAGKVGKSIATFLNGFNYSKALKTLGKTIGEAINTAIEVAHSFVTNFDFKAFGKSVANGLMAAIKKIDWKKAGKTISGFISGAFNGLASFFSNLDGKEIADSIIEFFKGVDWGAIAEAIWNALVEALKLAWDIVKELVGATIEKMEEWLSSGSNTAAAVVGAAPGSAGGGTAGGTSGFRVETTAEVTKVEDKVPSNQKFIDEMTAKLTKKTESFAHTSNTMTANLAKKSEGFKHTSNTMTAKLAKKSETFKKTVADMTAGLAYKSEEFSKKSTGWTAEITEVVLSGKAKTIVNTLINGKATGGVYRNGHWSPVTAAAGGGSFNTGQMFIARESGPELVGRIGRGTSVMNNDQIVASVSAGVAQAVASVLGSGSQNVTVYLEGDAGKVFRVVQKEANQYMNTTGMAPFPV